MKSFFIVAGVIFLSICVGCRHDPLKISVKHIPVGIVVERFDKELFSTDFDSVATAVPMLKDKYGDFLYAYSFEVLGIGHPDSAAYAGRLKNFVTNKIMQNLYSHVMKEYPDDDFLNARLTDAFKHYAYYFPDKKIPRVVTYVSGLNQSMAVAGNYMGIGLDKYLGNDFELYFKVEGLYKYNIYNMHKDKIPSDCMKALAMTQFENKDLTQNLCSEIIYNGKIMYFIKAMLPEEPDTLLFGFTPAQLKWCEKNEREMWTYLVEKKQLFETDRMTINKYIDDAPYTKDFTRDSPGRAVAWLGYRIVQSYIKENPEMTLPMLMSTYNAQQILALSNYNP